MKTTTPANRPAALPVLGRFRTLSTLMQLYVAGVVVVGTVILGHAVRHFPPDRAPLFVVLLLIAGVMSAVKVSLPLPGQASTLSFAYVVNFVALLSLGPVAVVPVAVASGWAQCTFGARRRNPAYRTLFSMAALGLTASAAGWAYVLTLSNVPRSEPTEVGAALIAATVYFLLNTLLVATAVALQTGSRIAGVWARDFLWSGPTYYVGALIAVLAVAVAGQGSLIWAVVLSIPAFVSYRSYRAYLERIAEEHERVEQTANLQLSVVESLALAIEAKDSRSRGHLVRMQVYAEGLARELGLPEDEVRGVRTAALLHDIGNLAVPEHILSKPGLLTKAEVERVRIHPRVGADILTTVPFPYPVAPLVLAHHERWDGRGYPSGLAGEQIPVGARILAVADCFTTMLADRPHRPARNFADAIATVRESSGSALDPAVVETFVRMLPRLESEVPGTAVSAAAAGPAAGSAAGALSDIAVAHREEQLLFEIAQGLGTTLHLTDVAALISTHLARLLPFTSSAVFLWDEAARRYSCQHATGAHQDAMRALTASTITGLRTALGGLAHLRDAEGPAPAPSLLMTTLHADGRAIGALVFCHVAKDVYTPDHDRLVARIAVQAAPVVANAMMFNRVREQSLTDPLTGLANRRFVEWQLERELSRARRLGSQLSVIFFDLDRFKGINDAFGHHAGDAALVEIARSLRSSLRDYDICARYGGDEFVVVLLDCDRSNAEARLRSIQGGFAATVFEPSPGQPVTLGLSGGAATFPVDGANAEALIAAADRRMFEDKARSRDADGSPAEPGEA